MTCWSCYWSRAPRDGKHPWCAEHNGPALRPCRKFDYEPGTDETER